MPNESPTRSKLVLLQPAPGQETESNSQSSETPLSRNHDPLPPRRSLVAVACDNCRARRTKRPPDQQHPSPSPPSRHRNELTKCLKCGGQRPSCNTCLAKGETCAYEAKEGETVRSSLKRRLRELEQENTSYKELYRLLRKRPESESEEILRRIRNTEDPLERRGLQYHRGPLAIPKAMEGVDECVGY